MSPLLRGHGPLCRAPIYLALSILILHSARAQEPVRLPPVKVLTPLEKVLKKSPRAAPENERGAAQDDPSTVPPSSPVQTPATTVLETSAGPVSGYAALTSVSGTKTATPIQNIPQSIQVIPRALIRDQQNVTVEEVLRNISAVQPTNAFQTPAYDSTRIRGFPAEILVDGFVAYYNTGDRDSLVNIERIEVLKGPTALLYGGGAGAPIGGAVDIVSKLPNDAPQGEFGFRFGSYTFLQPYFDINRPLNADKTVLFRMTGEYTSTESNVDVVEQKRYSLNPTWTFTNKTDTALTVQAKFSQWAQPEYQGLPAIGTVAGNYRINRDLFIGPANIPDSYSDYQGATVTLDHKFDSVWSGKIKARVSSSEFDEKAQSIVGSDGFQANTPFFPPASYGLVNADLFQKQHEFTINPSLTAKFDWGITRNTLLISADYSRIADKGFIAAAFLPGPAPFFVKLTDLRTPGFPDYTTPRTRSTDARNIYETSGATAQLQSDVWDKLHLLGGLRVSNVSIAPFNNLTRNAGEETDDTKLLPKAGAVFDLTKQFSVFADYGEGQKANPFVNYIGTPKPETADQIEGGVKFNLANTLTGTVAAFEINRQNVPVSVELGSVASGEQRSRGFEADVIWQPTSVVQIIGSYAYTDTVFVKDDIRSGAKAGNRVNGVPENSGRLWLNYKFDDERLRGWSVGAGIYAAGNQAVNLSNTYFTPAYYTVDAKIAYETERYTAGLSVKNLTGNEYFIPYNYFGGRVAPVDGPEFYATIAFKY